jgi:hypothetical protein
MPKPGQLDRQGAAHVGQPARLRKGNRFARGQQDIHDSTLQWGKQCFYIMSYGLAKQKALPTESLYFSQHIDFAEFIQ